VAYEMLFTPMGMLWLCLPSACPTLVLLAVVIYARIKNPNRKATTGAIEEEVT